MQIRFSDIMFYKQMFHVKLCLGKVNNVSRETTGKYLQFGNDIRH